MKLQLTTVPCPQTLEKTRTALGEQWTLSTGKEQQQCSAAAMCLQPAAAPIHAARTLPSLISSVQHPASPHQCQAFPPSQPMGCLIWLVICHPTKQKWPSQRPWVPTAMWEHTASTRDRPLCAGTMMGDGDSPGCPSRLNDAPGSGVSQRGCRRRVSPCAWGSGRKKEPFGASLNATLSLTYSSLPSQMWLQIALGQLSAPDVQTGFLSLVPAFTCFLGFYHQHFLVTGSFQAGGLSALMVTLTCTKLESPLGIHHSHFGNSTSLRDIHR